MCPLLFETIRVLQGNAQNLPWHQARAEQAGGAPLPPLAAVCSSMAFPAEGEYRLHLPYCGGQWLAARAQATAYTPRRIRSLLAVETDITYPRKSEDRRALDALKAAHPGADELVLCRGGCVTDTTYSNLLFGEPGRWETPDTPLLPGTMRARLLHLGLIRTARIRVQDIPHYPFVSLINAMLPPGRIMLPASSIALAPGR